MANKTNFNVNGSAYYRVTATIGKSPDGSRIRKAFYGKSKKEAEQKRDAYLGLINSGLGADFENRTIGEAVHIWLFEVVRVSDKIKPSTFSTYESVCRNYVEPYSFSQIPLFSVTPIMVQRFYNELYSAGKTSASITMLNRILSIFFNYCVTAGFLPRNPISGRAVTIPGKTEKKDRDIDAFNENEISVLVNGIKGHKYEMLILLALGTGLRRGELLGLQWKHIDFDSAEVTVEQTLTSYMDIDENGNRKHVVAIQTPKREASFRVVPIPVNLIGKLLKYKESARAKASALGIKFSEDDFVFTNSRYSHLSAGTGVLYSYKKILSSLGLRERDFHALRHTYATALISRDVNIETVSKLLGHTSFQTTQIYVHPQKDDKVNAVNLLNDIF